MRGQWMRRTVYQRTGCERTAVYDQTTHTARPQQQLPTDRRSANSRS